MEIDEEGKKSKIISENLSTIFSKEIEKVLYFLIKLTNCLEEIKEENSNSNQKLFDLVEKLEESLQQYGIMILKEELISFETDKLKVNLTEIIPNIGKNLIEEIAKIKNPNETLFDLMKSFYILIFPGKNFLWNIFQIESKNFEPIKHELDSFLLKDVNKEALDQCMPIYINNEEIKGSILKINKTFSIIVEFVKLTVEYNIKRNMQNNLYQSNINKNGKLQKIRQEIQEKESLLYELQNSLNNMQNELSLLVNQSNNQRNNINLHSNLISKYGLVHKYRIFLFNDDDINKPRVTIKLKGKFKSRDVFIHSILNLSNERNMMIEENKFIESSERKESDQIIPRLKLPFKINEELKSREEFSRENANKFFVEGKSKTNIGTTDILDKYRTNNSTIFRDLDALESIIRDEKRCDVVPIVNAAKPGPKQSHSDDKAEIFRVKEDLRIVEEGVKVMEIEEIKKDEVFDPRIKLNSTDQIDYYGYNRCNKNSCCK